MLPNIEMELAGPLQMHVGGPRSEKDFKNDFFGLIKAKVLKRLEGRPISRFFFQPTLAEEPRSR